MKQDNPRENVREEEMVLDENEAALDEEQEANLEDLEVHEGQAEGNEVVVEDIPRPQEVEADWGRIPTRDRRQVQFSVNWIW